MDQVVHEWVILEPASPACSRDTVRDAGHVLGATGQDDIGHIGLDHGHPRDHRLHARNAVPRLMSDGGYRFRDSRKQGSYSRRIQGVGIVLCSTP